MKKILISTTLVIFKKKNFLAKKLSLAIIPTSNNFQTNVRNVMKIFFYAILRDELYNFVEKYGGLYWKNQS